MNEVKVLFYPCPYEGALHICCTRDQAYFFMSKEGELLGKSDEGLWAKFKAQNGTAQILPEEFILPAVYWSSKVKEAKKAKRIDSLFSGKNTWEEESDYFSKMEGKIREVAKHVRKIGDITREEHRLMMRKKNHPSQQKFQYKKAA